MNLQSQEKINQLNLERLELPVFQLFFAGQQDMKQQQNQEMSHTLTNPRLINAFNQSGKINLSIQASKFLNMEENLQNQPQLPIKNVQQNNLNLHQHYTEAQDAYQSDDQFQDDFILQGANLQKDQITLTIVQKKLKNIEQNQIVVSQKQIQSHNDCNMEVQRENFDMVNLKYEQKTQSLNDFYEYRYQITTFSLKDSREIRKLRFMTPIRSLKKYILKKFGYSEGVRNCQILTISLFGLYQNQSPLIQFPITDQENLEFLIFELIKARKDIFIRFQNDGMLKKKIQRKNGQNQVQFDSDGQLQESQQSENQNQVYETEQQLNYFYAKQMIKVNRTQKSRYKDKKLVRCAFCQKTNKDIENIKICGPFYGPFLRGRIKTKYYTHLLCALWCKKVCLNDNNELIQIANEINRSQRKDCKYCSKKGAGLLCHGCASSMHYECGLGKCEYLWYSYELYCDKCHEKRKQKMLEQLQQEQSQEIQNKSINIECSQLFQDQNSIKQDSDLKKDQEKQQVASQYVIDPTQQQLMKIQNQKPYYELLQESRTQSLKNTKHDLPIIKEQQKLGIDTVNRIEINNESSDIQILQDKCKAPKNKLVFSQVKIEEQQISQKQKKRPRRGGGQKSKK